MDSTNSYGDLVIEKNTMFWETFRKWGSRRALQCGATSITYEHLDQLCDQFSDRLPEEKGLVLIEMTNSVECITAMYGSLRKGHGVLLCEKQNIALKEKLCKSFRPKVIFDKNSSGWSLHETIYKQGHPLHDDLALLLTTSGSTGEHKCVRLAKSNIHTNTESISSYLSITESDRCLLLLPICFSFGLSVLNTHLSKGASVFLQGPAVETPQFSQYLTKRKITCFSGVPHTFELLERTEFRDNSIPSLRYIAQAGGRMRKGLILDFNRWARSNGSRLFVMYGQTEASPRISYMPPDLLDNNPDCIGIPIPGGKLSIADTYGHPIEEIGREGELIYRGPNVMMGYAKNADDLSLGWKTESLSTGDLGMLTESNLYKITGRKKRICKIYGKRFNLDSIESILQQLDPTAVCCSDDESLLIASENIDMVLLSASVSKQFGIPQSNIISQHYIKIPLLASGKTDYAKIIKKSEEKPTNKKKTAHSSVKNELLNIYKNCFPDEPISPSNDSFISLGGDSLNYVALSVDLEKTLGQLPKKWEKMTLEELRKCHIKKKQYSLQTVETGILLRAIAIIAVVLQHYDLFVCGGAVVLLLVSGSNFSRFHLDSFLNGEIKPFSINFTKNILLPYWGVLFFYNLISFQRTEISPVIPEKFFLIGNYYYQVDWDPFPTWFIQVLFQTLVFVAVPLCIPAIRNIAKQNINRYLILLLISGVTYRILDSLYFMEMFPTRVADQRTAWEAWIFLFGMLIYRLKPGKEKRIAFIVLFFLSMIFWYTSWTRIVALVGFGLLLISKDQLYIPKTIVLPVKTLASASLYIYMAHLTGLTGYLKPYGPFIQGVAGIIQGILFWYLYSRGKEIIQGLFQDINQHRVGKY